MRSMLALWAVAGVLIASAVAEDVQVRLKSVTELRRVDLHKEKTDDSGFMFNNEEPHLTLSLQLKGPAAAEATHWGKLKIKTAKDDQGNTLKLRASEFSMNDPVKDFVEIDRERMFFGRDDIPDDLLEIDLTMAPSKRAAGKIAEIEGELQLRIGQREVVTVEDIKSHEGKTLDDATLEQAGVEVEIKEPDMGGFFSLDNPANGIVVAVRGKPAAVLSLTLQTPGGEEINVMQMTMNNQKERMFLLEADQALPKGAQLEITVATEQKDVKVPLKLKDIPLP